MIVWALLLWSAVTSQAEDDSQLRVNTTHGWLRGSYTTTRGGRTVRQFLGVHYAKSPTGERSFKSPELVDPWDGVKDATAECDVCMQQFTMLEATRYTVLGSEDCLCMNIFAPVIEKKEETPPRLLPTIFYIYGSAYTGLDMRKAYYGPKQLLDKDICLVVVGYRLGILGFLSTEDDVISGNFGLKDQALALIWIKKNLKSFGCDPDSITVMGESSGAGSTHLHLYSPLTRDHFHRAIMHSGSGLCLWGFSFPGEHTKKAKELADFVECPSSPSSAFLACMRKLPMATIVNTTHLFAKSIDADPVAYFNPVIEQECVKDAFLTKNPYNLSSKKPLLAGYNYAEGMMKMASMTSGDVEAKFKEWNDEFDNITMYRLLYYNRATDPSAVTKLVSDFYLGANTKLIDPSMLAVLVRMLGDFWFIQGTMDAVEYHQGPKWLYHYNYNTSVSVCSKIYNNPLYAGACHLDDMMNLFPMDIESNVFDEPSSPNYKLSEAMINLWTSFITNSVPTAAGITWNPVNSSALEYLDITNSGFAMKKNHIEERRKLWKCLPLKGKNETKQETIVYE